MNKSNIASKRSARKRNWSAGIRLVLILAVIVSIARSNREWILGKLRTFNKRYTNPRFLKIAGRHNSPYVVLQHVGRRSGSVYTIPVIGNFTQSREGFIMPLLYGIHTDWCRNVMAAGRCTITKDQVVYTVIEPTIIDAAKVLPELPVLLQVILRALGLKEFLKVRIENYAEVEKPVVLVTANER